MTKKNPFKAIAFDFDGVLVASNEVKTEAFRELFQNRPEHVDRIVAYHGAHGGISRFEKFRYFYEEYFKEPYIEAIEAELGNRFNHLVFERIIRCPEVPGALETLQAYYRSVPLYVISNTPQIEIIQIIERRGWARYFKKVFGSHTSKVEALTKILKVEGLSPLELVFVGDNITDYKAAVDAGVAFIGIDPNNNSFPADTVIIPDLRSFIRAVKTLALRIGIG